MMGAFLMGGWAIQLDVRAGGLDEDYAADIVIAGVIGGLIGAKLWYVFLKGDADMLLRRGGFVWYGGFVGATAAILLDGWGRRPGPPFPGRNCAAPLPPRHPPGPLGCFLVDAHYGRTSHPPRRRA